MRILHTSDWHLGKRLMDRERIPEQAAALDELTEICEEKKVDLVLVAGDVFDTFLPPAEAEELFFRAVKALAGSSRAVVCISGNHDDGVRLAASHTIAAANGVYLFGGHNVPPLGDPSRRVHLADAGPNYAVVRCGEESVYLGLLPYPNEARLKEERTEESYAEKMARRISEGDARYDGKMPHILMSHLFVAGGKVSEGERDISLGGARAVPAEIFPSFGYVALGHLHRHQKAGANIRYSGSLLRYSFDEAGSEKYAILLETAGEKVEVCEEIPLTGGKPLARLEANGPAEGIELVKNHLGEYVELTLNLREPLSAEETKALGEANPGVLSLITHVGEREECVIVKRSEWTAKELFAQFYKSQFGEEEPSEELVEVFLEALEAQE